MALSVSLAPRYGCAWRRFTNDSRRFQTGIGVPSAGLGLPGTSLCCEVSSFRNCGRALISRPTARFVGCWEILCSPALPPTLCIRRSPPSCPAPGLHDGWGREVAVRAEAFCGCSSLGLSSAPPAHTQHELSAGFSSLAQPWWILPFDHSAKMTREKAASSPRKGPLAAYSWISLGFLASSALRWVVFLFDFVGFLIIRARVAVL